MAIRTTSRDVVFHRPFILDGMETVQPAGVYTVDTDEEQMAPGLFPGRRRIRMVIRIVGTDATQYLPVRPEQLHEALMRDGAQESACLSASSGMSGARRSRARAMRLRL